MAFPAPPWSGIVDRVKGKMAAAVGLVGQLFVGNPTDNDTPASPPVVFGIFATYGAPTNGGSGTYANVAPKGSVLVDTQNATVYQNTNTQASPTWTLKAATGATGATGPVGPTGPTGSSALETYTDTITAHSGGGQTSAVALTTQLNRVSVVGATGDSVKLPASVAGTRVEVINDGANQAQVFGTSPDTVDGVVTGTGVPLSAAKRSIFWCVTAGAWQSLGGGKST